MIETGDFPNPTAFIIVLGRLCDGRVDIVRGVRLMDHNLP